MRGSALILAGILVGGLVIAGCTEPPASGSEGGKADPKRVGGAAKPLPAALAGKLLAHSATGAILVPDQVFATLPNVSYVSVGKNGPEPSIGVTKNGIIFFQAISGGAGTGGVPTGPATLRSDDGGVTWRNVAQAPFTSPTSLDPFLWVDPVTDRVFVDHLYVGCSYLSFSDDYGATWVANPIACGLPGNDHQKITTGPFRAPLTATPAYKNVVYYGYNGLAAGSRVSVSLDGGVTWPYNSQSVPPGTCSGGLHGRLHAGPDGYVYVPKRDCGGNVVAISADNGITWTQVKMGQDVGAPDFRKNPEIAIDSQNNVYIVWPGKDNRLYLSVSRDHGKTWSRSVLASPPDITTTTMPSIVAGDAGRISFAYYGVAFGNGEHPECVGNTETWDVYVGWSLNALDENPSFVTARANDINDPVQIGGISTNSGAPPADKNCKYRRNLLDFIDMTTDREGRIYVATADGCLLCTTFEESVAALGMASTQVSGPSLLATVPDFTAPPKGKT